MPATARTERSYDVTPGGQVVVRPEALRESKIVEEIHNLAKEIVEISSARAAAETHRDSKQEQDRD